MIDKGTIDAMLCSAAGAADAASICAEAARVLRPEGVFVLVSHLSPMQDDGATFLNEALLPALQRFAGGVRWDIGVHCKADDESESETREDGGAEDLPHVYVIRKRTRRRTRASQSGREAETEIPLVFHEY